MYACTHELVVRVHTHPLVTSQCKVGNCSFLLKLKTKERRGGYQEAAGGVHR